MKLPRRRDIDCALSAYQTVQRLERPAANSKPAAAGESSDRGKVPAEVREPRGSASIVLLLPSPATTHRTFAFAVDHPRASLEEYTVTSTATSIRIAGVSSTAYTRHPRQHALHQTSLGHPRRRQRSRRPNESEESYYILRPRSPRWLTNRHRRPRREDSHLEYQTDLELRL